MHVLVYEVRFQGVNHQRIPAFRWPLFAMILLLLTLSSEWVAPSRAQDAESITNHNAAGLIPFNSYQFGDIDSVNLGSGGVSFRIPLIRVQGRGMDDGLQLIFNTKFRTLNFSRMIVGNQIKESLAWTLSLDTPSTFQIKSLHGGAVSFDGESYTCTVGAGSWNVKDDSNFTFVDADGSKYLFPNRVVYPLGQALSTDCPQWNFGNMQTTTTGLSDSGTLQLTTSVSNSILSYTVTDKAGRLIVGGWTDTNGNVNSGALGRAFTSTRNSDGSVSITMVDSNGQTQTYKLIYQTLSGPTAQFPTSSYNGVTVQNTTVGGPGKVLTQVSLPNGTAYQISYQLADGTLNPFGEPTKITLPTGGYIRYVYQTIPTYDQYIVKGNGPCGFQALIDSRRVVERDVSPDGVTEQKWQYSYQSSPNTTIVTDPLGNVTIHTFSTFNGDTTGIHEGSTEIRNGATTVVKRITNTWAADLGPIQALQARSTSQVRGDSCTGNLYLTDFRNYRITNVTTTLVDANQTTQKSTTYDAYTYTFDVNDTGGTNPVTMNDTRMNPVETDEYDYGSGAAGPLLRKTTFAYLQDSNANYLNKHIWDRVALKQIFDNSASTCKGQSQPCAQTKFVYDSTPIITASGAVQHDYTNFPSSMTIRGNQTEIQRWRNTDGVWLVTKNTYDELGNLRQVQDPLGNPPTTYDYTDSWGTQTGATTCLPSGGTAQAFPTTVTDALGHSSSAKFYSCSSLVASTKDQNSNTTSFSYDLFGRPTSTSFPDGGSTNWAFNDSARTATETKAIGNGVGPLTKVFSYDGFERITQVKLPSDPDCTSGDETDTTYDALGRVHTVSKPYCSTSDPTYGLTPTTRSAALVLLHLRRARLNRTAPLAQLPAT